MKIRDLPKMLKQLLLLVCTAGCILLFQHSASAAPKAIDKNHTSCSMCHRTENPALIATVSLTDTDMSQICMDCHHYSENHHPVNFVPDRELDSRYPLINGEVRCLTCHQAHGNGKIRKAYPKLLRGSPYTDRREICFGCHFEDQYININPHLMLKNDGSVTEINGKLSCLFCHTVVPDQTNPDEQVTFRADVAFLCWRCHPAMPGEFLNNHFLKKPSKKTDSSMKLYEQRAGIRFPILNRDRITCSTCHNPHQEGVIQNMSVSSGADAVKRLRVEAGQICHVCHSGI